MSSVTIRIPDRLRRQLDKLSREKQQPLSDLVRDSLKRYVASEELRQIRESARRRAGERGYLVDDDVFKAVS